MNNVFFRVVAKIRMKATIDRAIVARGVKVKNERVAVPGAWPIGLLPVIEKPPSFGLRRSRLSSAI